MKKLSSSSGYQSTNRTASVSMFMPPSSVADRGRARNQVGRAGSVAINIRLLSGGPPKADRKQTTTLRLDLDLLEHFRNA
jgi:uncharacterized protein (DUF4415 family)